MPFPDSSGVEDTPAARLSLAFYRDDYVLVLVESVQWLRFGGKPYRRQGS